MKTFSRRHFAATLACVPVILPLSNLALADGTTEPKRPLRIYSTAKGDKLTITTSPEGYPIFNWEAAKPE